MSMPSDYPDYIFVQAGPHEEKRGKAHNYASVMFPLLFLLRTPS